MNFVDIFKVLGDDTRIRMFNILSQEQLCVCEIETILDITQSNASRHLNRLKTAKIINYDKKSQWIYYYIDKEFIKENKLLYNYLIEKIKTNNKCMEDIKILKKYRESNLNCKNIRENKEEVVQLIRKKCKCNKK
ncbi:ArsR/SmtB family transcription factor [Haloimpatiens sp. FM7330]|uniref:ArsR/SmtB family transcription factor n=1 Tax=Haloimpatiens sp. FM7330 TaxID=3298610 RepID=UPI0036285F17